MKFASLRSFLTVLISIRVRNHQGNCSSWFLNHRCWLVKMGSNQRFLITKFRLKLGITRVLNLYYVDVNTCLGFIMMNLVSHPGFSRPRARDPIGYIHHYYISRTAKNRFVSLRSGKPFYFIFSFIKKDL